MEVEEYALPGTNEIQLNLTSKVQQLEQATGSRYDASDYDHDSVVVRHPLGSSS